MAHLLDIWEEAHFQLISIAAQHVAGCCLLFQDTGPDADLAVPIVQSLSLQHETKVRVDLKTQLYTHISWKSMLASPISPVLCSLLLTSVQQCCQFQQSSVQRTECWRPLWHLQSGLCRIDLSLPCHTSYGEGLTVPRCCCKT